jgi:hypothetical protein
MHVCVCVCVCFRGPAAPFTTACKRHLLCANASHSLTRVAKHALNRLQLGKAVGLVRLEVGTFGPLIPRVDNPVCVCVCVVCVCGVCVCVCVCVCDSVCVTVRV